MKKNFKNSRLQQFKDVAAHKNPFGVNVTALRRAGFSVIEQGKNILAQKGRAVITCPKDNVNAAVISL